MKKKREKIGLIDADRLIEALEDLNVHYNNDYYTNNREPMLIYQEVFETIKKIANER